jgi:hypothetical protein
MSAATFRLPEAASLIPASSSHSATDIGETGLGGSRPPSPLEKIQPDGWLGEYTEDLLNLLNVLGRLVALEPRQADLLERIVAGRLVLLEALQSEGELGTTEGDASK